MYRQRLGKLSAHLDIPLKKEQTILVLLIDKVYTDESIPTNVMALVDFSSNYISDGLAKIYEFRCHAPENLKSRELTELTVDDICKEELSQSVIPSEDLSSNYNIGVFDQYQPTGQDNNNQQRNGDFGEISGRHDLKPVNADGNEQQLATAGSSGISTEMIIVICVVIACIIVIIISLIVYSSRKRAQRRKQQERNLGVSHKTNSYW
ncbi:unnamed protein product [Schistosoma margrebowiei]|uniref:Uncharacterized protein n=2 Tax=Schistosoma TaxID=6181 RepID=A0A183M4D3_9TREM|nr:unnamed protein product [Schistosoma margrebowiei]